MHITIAAIGKLKASSAEQELIAHYLKRLPWTVEFKEYEVRKSLPDAQLKEQEAALLLQAIPPGAKVIALDEHGKQYGSEAFASTLKRLQEDGARQFILLIGGAAGHGKAVLDRADITLSLGQMTWPHMMVRVLLAEQLYRAYTIQTGHPYHKV